LGIQRLPPLRRPVARAAVLGRLNWRAADVVGVVPETARVKTIQFDVPDWPGHLPGQHVDVRLTAEDGYQAQRSYSIASAPDGTREAGRPGDARRSRTRGRAGLRLWADAVRRGRCKRARRARPRAGTNQDRAVRRDGRTRWMS